MQKTLKKIHLLVAKIPLATVKYAFNTRGPLKPPAYLHLITKQ